MLRFTSSDQLKLGKTVCVYKNLKNLIRIGNKNVLTKHYLLTRTLLNIWTNITVMTF
jgi:hypothetical protein